LGADIFRLVQTVAVIRPPPL